jgi:hypothetical protein
MTTIHVTQHDIEHGALKSCHYCPIALALQRTLALKSYQIEVRHKAITIWPESRMEKQWYELPRAAQVFIFAYDDCRNPDPAPFSFALDLPE